MEQQIPPAVAPLMKYIKLYFEKSYFEGANRTEPGVEEDVDMVLGNAVRIVEMWPFRNTITKKLFEHGDVWLETTRRLSKKEMTRSSVRTKYVFSERA